MQYENHDPGVGPQDNWPAAPTPWASYTVDPAMALKPIKPIRRGVDPKTDLDIVEYVECQQDLLDNLRAAVLRERWWRRNEVRVRGVAGLIGTIALFWFYS